MSYYKEAEYDCIDSEAFIGGVSYIFSSLELVEDNYTLAVL